MISAATFRDLPPSTVARRLSLLAARGDLTRLARGRYYVPRTSDFGPVPANPRLRVSAAIGEPELIAGGVAAANALGFTTQLPMGTTDVLSMSGHRVRTAGLRGVRVLERDPSRRGLSRTENEFLEVLRGIASLSSLSPPNTCARACELVAKRAVDLTAPRMIRAARHEPARVRAMLGALAEANGLDTKPYRDMVHPASRYDFGPLSLLPTAGNWGAK